MLSLHALPVPPAGGGCLASTVLLSSVGFSDAILLAVELPDRLSLILPIGGVVALCPGLPLRVDPLTLTTGDVVTEPCSVLSRFIRAPSKPIWSSASSSLRRRSPIFMTGGAAPDRLVSEVVRVSGGGAADRSLAGELSNGRSDVVMDGDAGGADRSGSASSTCTGVSSSESSP